MVCKAIDFKLLLFIENGHLSQLDIPPEDMEVAKTATQRPDWVGFAATMQAQLLYQNLIMVKEGTDAIKTLRSAGGGSDIAGRNTAATNHHEVLKLHVPKIEKMVRSLMEFVEKEIRG